MMPVVVSQLGEDERLVGVHVGVVPARVAVLDPDAACHQDGPGGERRRDADGDGCVERRSAGPAHPRRGR